MLQKGLEGENKRLEAVRLYEILDTIQEQEYDDIATLAAEICKTPIALITIVDENRQWFKSKIGLDISETGRDVSFCARAIEGSELFEVNDPVNDPSFADNPFVTGYPNIRYYAGAPLVTSDGQSLGTLCVIHTQSHQLTDSQKRSLAILSRSVMTLLELKLNQKQTNFFRSALDEIAAVAVFDKESNFEYANEKYCALTGLPEHEIVGKNYSAIALADISEDVNKRIFDAVSKGNIFRDTIKNISKKGDVTWSNLSVIPYLNESKEIIKLFTIRVDATSVVQLIDRFHKAEKMSRLGCWEINLLNGKRYWSEGLYALIGFDNITNPDNIPSLSDYIVPEHRASAEVSLNNVVNGDLTSGMDEIDVITVDGVRKTMFITKEFTFDSKGKPLAIRGTVQDITEKKKTEEILKASFEEVKSLSDSREVLALTADNLSAMLAYWDKSLICRFANSAYLQWFGRSREEMINKITIIELLGPLYEKNKPYIDGVLAGHVQTFEREIPLPDGKGTRYSLANYFPHIVGGEVNGFFVHVADITPQKLLEVEIRETSDKVKEQNKRLVNFANIVTHNLKSYAHNLGVILELYIIADKQSEKERMLGFLQEIAEGFTTTIVHLSDIVDTQNRLEIKRVPLVLYDYVKRAVDTLHIEIKNSNATIANNVESHLIFDGNPAYMDSIFLNFLSNAIKYKHPDRDPIITVDAKNTESELVLTIADNGRGINLATNGEKLFGMYETFHGNTDATGIGLYLVRSQVESMNGTVEISSEENVGTTFTIRFKK